MAKKSECVIADAESTSSWQPVSAGGAASAKCARQRAVNASKRAAAVRKSRRLSSSLERRRCNLDCSQTNSAAAAANDAGQQSRLFSPINRDNGEGAVAAAAADAAAVSGRGHEQAEMSDGAGGGHLPKTDDEWSADDADEPQVAKTTTTTMTKKKGPTKHIHPCVCDLSKKQRATIERFLQEKKSAQQKFERRVQEIEEEIRMAEEAEQQRIREQEAEKEFYGDEYEMEGAKRKRKKRSARRASMVSLGVKQVINWRKPPRIQVRFTRTSNLRATSSTYCRPPLPPLPQIRPVEINFNEPEIPIRANKAVELRIRFIKNHIQTSKERQVKVKYPKRPPFVTQYW